MENNPLCTSTIMGCYNTRSNPSTKQQRFQIVGNLRIDSSVATGNPLALRAYEKGNKDRFITTSSTHGSHNNVQQELKPFDNPNRSKVLRFYTFFLEKVDESPEELSRVRKTILLYYLEDDSIEILEPKESNSGLPQGTYLKRSRLKKSDGEFYQWKDFNIGMNFRIYGRSFLVYDCDKFTRGYYQETCNIEFPPAIEFPLDEHTKCRDQIANLCGGKSGQFYGKLNSALKTFMEASLGNSQARSSQQGEKKRKFLQNARKVLRFECEYDERDRLYGELLSYTLNYFLEDDTIEIKENIKPNSGKDPFPLLLSRSRVSKQWEDSLRDEQDRGVETPPPKEAYYNSEDLYVGAVVKVYNRSLKLVDADKFTRLYYRECLNVELGDPQYHVEEVKELVKSQPPPHNGYGTEEDSLGSCSSLVPKVPKKDFKKFEKFDSQVLRFSAKQITNRREQQNRRFVITYYLADDTVAIYEPEQRNSGIMGGKFLEKGKYKKAEGGAYTATDFYLGAEVVFNSYKFLVLDSDDFTKKKLTLLAAS